MPGTQVCAFPMALGLQLVLRSAKKGGIIKGVILFILLFASISLLAIDPGTRRPIRRPTDSNQPVPPRAHEASPEEKALERPLNSSEASLVKWLDENLVPEGTTGQEVLRALRTQLLEGYQKALKSLEPREQARILDNAIEEVETKLWDLHVLSKGKLRPTSELHRKFLRAFAKEYGEGNILRTALEIKECSNLSSGDREKNLIDYWKKLTVLPVHENIFEQQLFGQELERRKTEGVSVRLTPGDQYPSLIVPLSGGGAIRLTAKISHPFEKPKTETEEVYTVQ